ncbi:hypothetical protein CDCA_CDCA11G3228 [Cyanidium caldarium]|uniref:Rab3-GAP regulatory subunit N-terminal domain-containing protein n=1 Tax=Cyanidium caldarium TaxID=2771 RepID=A0AAV9IYL4_CYACA|nr:hypothetical protein CDCA_CDCA11G3228 [Cyanidium caldarium]
MGVMEPCLQLPVSGLHASRRSACAHCGACTAVGRHSTESGRERSPQRQQEVSATARRLTLAGGGWLTRARAWLGGAETEGRAPEGGLPQQAPSYGDAGGETEVAYQRQLLRTRPPGLESCLSEEQVECLRGYLMGHPQHRRAAEPLLEWDAPVSPVADADAAANGRSDDSGALDADSLQATVACGGVSFGAGGATVWIATLERYAVCVWRGDVGTAEATPAPRYFVRPPLPAGAKTDASSSSYDSNIWNDAWDTESWDEHDADEQPPPGTPGCWCTAVAEPAPTSACFLEAPCEPVEDGEEECEPASSPLPSASVYLLAGYSDGALALFRMADEGLADTLVDDDAPVVIQPQIVLHVRHDEAGTSTPPLPSTAWMAARDDLVANVQPMEHEHWTSPGVIRLTAMQGPVAGCACAVFADHAVALINVQACWGMGGSRSPVPRAACTDAPVPAAAAAVAGNHTTSKPAPWFLWTLPRALSPVCDALLRCWPAGGDPVDALESLTDAGGASYQLLALTSAPSLAVIRARSDVQRQALREVATKAISTVSRLLFGGGYSEAGMEEPGSAGEATEFAPDGNERAAPHRHMPVTADRLVSKVVHLLPVVAAVDESGHNLPQHASPTIPRSGGYRAICRLQREFDTYASSLTRIELSPPALHSKTPFALASGHTGHVFLLEWSSAMPVPLALLKGPSRRQTSWLWHWDPTGRVHESPPPPQRAEAHLAVYATDDGRLEVFAVSTVCGVECARRNPAHPCSLLHPVVVAMAPPQSMLLPGGLLVTPAGSVFVLSRTLLETAAVDADAAKAPDGMPGEQADPLTELAAVAPLPVSTDAAEVLRSIVCSGADESMVADAIRSALVTDAAESVAARDIACRDLWARASAVAHTLTQCMEEEETGRAVASPTPLSAIATSMGRLLALAYRTAGRAMRTLADDEPAGAQWLLVVLRWQALAALADTYAEMREVLIGDGAAQPLPWRQFRDLFALRIRDAPDRTSIAEPGVSDALMEVTLGRAAVGGRAEEQLKVVSRWFFERCVGDATQWERFALPVEEDIDAATSTATALSSVCTVWDAAHVPVYEQAFLLLHGLFADDWKQPGRARTTGHNGDESCHARSGDVAARDASANARRETLSALVPLLAAFLQRCRVADYEQRSPDTFVTPRASARQRLDRLVYQSICFSRQPELAERLGEAYIRAVQLSAAVDETMETARWPSHAPHHAGGYSVNDWRRVTGACAAARRLRQLLVALGCTALIERVNAHLWLEEFRGGTWSARQSRGLSVPESAAARRDAADDEEISVPAAALYIVVLQGADAAAQELVARWDSLSEMLTADDASAVTAHHLTDIDCQFACTALFRRVAEAIIEEPTALRQWQSALSSEALAALCNMGGVGGGEVAVPMTAADGVDAARSSTRHDALLSVARFIEERCQPLGNSQQRLLRQVVAGLEAVSTEV